MLLEESKNYVQPLLNALAIAAALANVLLLLAVVAAKQYGVDIKDWRQMVSVSAKPQPTATAASNTSAPPLPLVAMDQSGEVPEAVSQSFSLTVPPKQSLVFNFAMARDYELDYHWQTSDGKTLHAQLRGQKQGSKQDDVRVFGKIKKSKGKGFFIAPFDGDFALQWQNHTDQPVIVRLTAKGVFKVLG